MKNRQKRLHDMPWREYEPEPQSVDDAHMGDCFEFEEVYLAVDCGFDFSQPAQAKLFFESLGACAFDLVRTEGIKMLPVLPLTELF